MKSGPAVLEAPEPVVNTFWRGTDMHTVSAYRLSVKQNHPTKLRVWAHETYTFAWLTAYFTIALW